jgi:hypothetical protein
VREAVAASILRVGKEDGETNLADLLTKVMTDQKRWDFCWQTRSRITWFNSTQN